jgi:hypothetical protein
VPELRLKAARQLAHVGTVGTAARWLGDLSRDERLPVSARVEAAIACVPDDRAGALSTLTTLAGDDGLRPLTRLGVIGAVVATDQASGMEMLMTFARMVTLPAYVRIEAAVRLRGLDRLRAAEVLMDVVSNPNTSAEDRARAQQELGQS